jgi:hypothetical protein
MPYSSPVSEQDIQTLESQFPAMSQQAFAAARQRVLASGQSVLQAEGGRLVREFPDGRKELVKNIEPPTPVEPGTILTIP